MDSNQRQRFHELFYTFASVFSLYWFVCVQFTFAQAPLDSLSFWSSLPSDYTRCIAWGDIDGDGDLDLACGNSNGSNAIYLNKKGELIKTPSWTSEPSNDTHSIAFGDVDGDGDLDLACGNYNQSNTVYLNINGVLERSPSWYSIPFNRTQSIAWGDVDVDGDLDLVCGNYDQPNKVYLNNGGVLEHGPSWSSDSSYSTKSIALGDVDGDGNLDLVCGNWNQSNTVYLNGGRAPLWFSIPTNYTQSIALGDVNGDGTLDLVCGNGDRGSIIPIGQSNTIYLNVNGMFERSPAWQSIDTFYTTCIALGDLDRDGDLDLACGNGPTGIIDLYQPNTVYLNKGVMLERKPAWYSETTMNTTGVAFGDVDGDGDLDLAYGNVNQPNRVYFCTEGLFEKIPSWSSLLDKNTQSIAWGDMDGDGDLDLACGNKNDKNTVYHNVNGTLERMPGWFSQPTNNTKSVAWGDLNGDGYLELACGNENQQNTIYLNNSGNLDTAPYWSSDSAKSTQSIAWGDVDGDGDLDLVCGNYDQPNTVYLNNNGVLEVTPSWLSEATYRTKSIALGDVDRDGDLDLACGNDDQPNTIYLYLNIKRLFQTTPTWVSSTDNDTRSIAWGDMDGDGYLDLACANFEQSNTVYLNNDELLEIIPSWSSALNNRTEGIAWGDLDGDGDLDLVCGNRSWSLKKEYSTAYLNHGGILQATPSWSSDTTMNINSIALGDMDGDGDLDLACGNIGYNSVYKNKTNVTELGNLPNDWSFIRSMKKISHDMNSNTITFQYELVDNEEDRCNIVAEYSPNGGGQWFKATQKGGDDITDLVTDPDGISYMYIWDLEEDNVQGTNVVFRMRVFSNPDLVGLIQRPYTTFQIPIGTIDNKPHISLLSPQEHDIVGGIVPIIGKVWDATNFDRYEIDISGKVVIQSHQSHSQEGQLFSLDVREFQEDLYTINVKAFDKSNNETARSIQVNVVSLPDEPRVILKYPTNNSETVSLNSPIIAQFNSKMNQVSLDGQTLVVRGANQQIVPGNVVYDYHTQTLTYLPGDYFEKNSFYYVTISHAFQNESGLPLKANTVWSFTTEDNEIPFDIIQTEPANGFAGFSVTDTIKVLLDINSSYRGISIRDLAGTPIPYDTIIYHPRPIDGELDISFIPNNLSGAALYLVTLSTDRIRANTESYTFYFITEDVETLEITTTSPDDGEIISPLDFEISATFSKDMNPNTLDSTTVFLKKDEKDESAIITYSVPERKVLITPRDDLEQNADYTVRIDRTVQSRGGLLLDSDVVWQFYTAPIITVNGGAVASIDGLVEMQFPPNALNEDSPIIIQKITANLDQFEPSDAQLRLLKYPYKFTPNPISFNKPVTLRMKTVMGDSLADIDQKKLAIFEWSEQAQMWMRKGGAVHRNVDTVLVNTTIEELGQYYAILEDKSTGLARTLANVSSQPRIFSPQGGGHDTRTAISFELGKESNVNIKVYNMAGRVVCVLKESEPMNHGNNVVFWDGKDERGNYCTSGLYIVTIQAEEKMATKTVVVLNKY